MRRLRIALLIAAFCAATAACTRQPGIDQAALRAAVGNEPVVLLSASWCSYCRKLRADLKQWGVHYREYDIERSEAGMRAFSLLKSSGVPVLIVGEQRFHGYVPRQIHESLSEAGLLPPAASP
jgi:glutaredoxin